MRSKRGLEHVEFILSFILFVGFLAFALYFFSPLRGDRIVDSTLFYTTDEIVDNVSVEVETLSVIINENVTAGIVGIPVDGRENSKASAEDSQGTLLTNYFDSLGEIVFVQRLGERFVAIKFSSDFSEGQSFEGEELEESNYSVSSSDSQIVLSEKRISALAEKYNSGDEGYQELKKNFNLPSRASFGFSLIFTNGEKIEADRTVPEGLEVFSERKRYEVLRATDKIDKIEFADLEVRVW